MFVSLRFQSVTGKRFIKRFVCPNPHWLTPGHNQPDTLIHFNTLATNTRASHYGPLYGHFIRKCSSEQCFVFDLFISLISEGVGVWWCLSYISSTEILLFSCSLPTHTPIAKKYFGHRLILTTSISYYLTIPVARHLVLVFCACPWHGWVMHSYLYSSFFSLFLSSCTVPPLVRVFQFAQLRFMLHPH